MKGRDILNDNLKRSWDKICRYDNQSSFTSRRTYRQEQKAFLEYVSERFNLQSLKRLQNKHATAYINEQLDKGIKKSSMQKSMVAIRRLNEFCDGQIDITNKQLGIDGKDKAVAIAGMSDSEYQRALEIAQDKDPNGFILFALQMGNEFGLRSNEIVNMQFGEIRECVVTGKLNITHGTKGGRPRQISYSNKEFLRELISTDFCEGKSNSDKILCSREKGSVKKRLSQLHDWFSKNSDKIIDTDREEKTIAAHSLRRRFAQNRYDSYISSGMNDSQAMSHICRDLGHGSSYKTMPDGTVKFTREDITSVYVKHRIIERSDMNE